MNATLLAVLLCLASAVTYATAAVAQERLARRATARTAGALFGQGAWWWAAGLNAAAALLHAAALRYGPLTLVQPLGALTLVAAVPLGARGAGRRVVPAEWRGTLATVAGLGLLLLPASGPAPDDTLTLPEALAVSGATAAVIMVLTARKDPKSGLRHATASGLASAVASALTQTVAVAGGRGGSLLSLRVVAVAALVVLFAVGGLLLSQRAYRGGLGAPLAVVNLANPLAAAAIGMILLGERLQGGALGVLLAVTGALAATRGVLLLTRTAPAALEGAGQGAPELGPIGGGREGVEDGRGQGRVQTGVVDLAQFRPYREGQPLPVEVEAGVHAGLVAPGVQPGPAVAAGQAYRDQAVQDQAAAVVLAQELVAQGRGDGAVPQQRGQRHGLGVADAVAGGEDVGGPPGDPRVPGVRGVRDGVAHELKSCLRV